MSPILSMAPRRNAPRQRINVEHVRLENPIMQQSPRELQHPRLDFEKSDILEIVQLKVLPLLRLRHLFAVDRLLDLLFLFVDLDDVAPPNGVASTVRARSVRDDVRNDVHALEGRRHQSVGCNSQPADGSFAVNRHVDGALAKVIALGCGGGHGGSQS